MFLCEAQAGKEVSCLVLALAASLVKGHKRNISVEFSWNQAKDIVIHSICVVILKSRDICRLYSDDKDFLKNSQWTGPWARDPESQTCSIYYHTEHLCEVTFKSINKYRPFSNDKVFSKNSQSDLDLEPRTWKQKLLKILSYPTFVWSNIKIHQ